MGESGSCLLKEMAVLPPRHRIQLSEMEPRICFSSYFPGSWTRDHTFEKPSSRVQGCVVLVTRSHLTLCDAMNCSLLGSSVHGSPGKSTGVGSHSLLQGIFPTQGSNSGLQHCRQILYCLSHQGSPESRTEV